MSKKASAKLRDDLNCFPYVFERMKINKKCLQVCVLSRRDKLSLIPSLNLKS